MLVPAVGDIISVGVTASVPKTKDNGVCPVTFLGVVLSARGI